MPDPNTGKTTFGGVIPAAEGEWQEYRGNAYRCQLYLLPKDGGGYLATAATLPNIAEGGATEQEAVANITRSLVAVLSAWKQSGVPIPWHAAAEEAPVGAKAKWVIIHL
ncbi:MAG TPA: hypothetical protein VKA46_20305 [Gemmataceae bacterium]|nr:hypothetical protein [Gemmataceae bacterium]